MTELLFEYDHLLIHSEYRTPEVHSHLASHLMIALEGSLECEIGGEVSENTGVCIASDAAHTVYSQTGDMLLYLFDTTSSLSDAFSEKYLRGRRFCVLDSTLVNDLREIWKSETAAQADMKMLERCGLLRTASSEKDERITAVLEYLRGIQTVPEDIMEQLCRTACLSQSRLSHLFREQVGISLHRYLALDKMKKGYICYKSCGSITEAAMTAGFDSPSHFAATCKRMFGISFSEIMKS